MAPCSTVRNGGKVISVDQEDKENASVIRTFPGSSSSSSSSSLSSSFAPSATTPRRRRRQSPDETARRRRRTAPESLLISSASTTPASHHHHAPDPPPAADAVTITTSGAKVVFPRRLARPDPLPVIPSSHLTSIDPALEGVSPRVVQERLRPLGPALMAVLGSARAAPASGLPESLDVLVPPTAREAELPTHLLAVHSKGPRTAPAGATSEPAPKRPVTLFPVHDLVLAAHCASLPDFPPSPAARRLADLTHPAPAAPAKQQPGEARRTVALPIVTFCIPSPATFPILQGYLYTKEASQVLARLLPQLPPDARAPVSGRPDPAALSKALRAACTPATLLQHTLAVHGLWSNVCVLGVADEKLWKILDLAWDVLVGAMAEQRAVAVSSEKCAAMDVEQAAAMKQREIVTADDADMPALLPGRSSLAVS